MKLPVKREKVIFTIIFLLIVGGYFGFIHKFSSREFLELHREEQALHLPKPWRRDTSDFGCHKVTYKNETECDRHINLIYTDTNLKTLIEQRLSNSGWSSHHDRGTNFSSKDFNKNELIHFDSWNLYTKDSPLGKLCALVTVESNANYKKDGPWAVTLQLFGKTEDCNRHI
jgi:hypothetical protein